MTSKNIASEPAGRNILKEGVEYESHCCGIRDRMKLGFVLLIICLLPRPVLASQLTQALGQSRGIPSAHSFSHHSLPRSSHAFPFRDRQPHSGLRFHKEGTIGPHGAHPHRHHKRLFKKGFFPFFYQPYPFRDRSYDDMPPASAAAEDLTLKKRSPEPAEKLAPLPHPLIIEERCGRFVSIPWPESGSLDEVSTTQPCPD